MTDTELTPKELADVVSLTLEVTSLDQVMGNAYAIYLVQAGEISSATQREVFLNILEEKAKQNHDSAGRIVNLTDEHATVDAVKRSLVTHMEQLITNYQEIVAFTKTLPENAGRVAELDAIVAGLHKKCNLLKEKFLPPVYH